MYLKQKIFSDSLNASKFYIDLRKALSFKVGYLNTHALLLFREVNIIFSLSNLDNSKINLLFSSLNLIYELTLCTPYVYCGSYRWLSKGKALGLMIKMQQKNLPNALLIIRSISIINQLRFVMILKNLRIFRTLKKHFQISIPFYDVTKSALITNDWYFDWNYCIFISMITNILSFRELRYLLKFFDIFADQSYRGNLVFRKLKLNSKLALLKSTQVKLLIIQSKEALSTNNLFRKYILHFFF